MAISLSRYVDITSGLGGGAVASTRTLVGRMFTGNELLPPDTFLSFSNPADVGTFFGTGSEEYARAQFYFSWVSKNTTSPQSIQFARWVNVAQAAMIYYIGNNGTNLSNWTTITAGSFGLTIGGVAHTFSSLDFSAAASLSDVASILQSVIRMQSGSQWTAATVTYSSATGSFNFVSGETIAATISVQAGVSNDITGPGLLGWIPQSIFTNGTLVPSQGAVWSPGAVVESITNCLNASSDGSNNFGSFLFLDNLSLTLDQVIEAAEWNQLQNVVYLYTVPIITANLSAWTNVSTGIGGIGGVALTLSDTVGEYPEQIPMMIEAATDYTGVNSVQNYMFQMFGGITATVNTDTEASSLDGLAVNYYGATQTAGQQISFYQRGLLQGGNVVTNITDMTAYVNEIWLKDAAGVALLNLLLGLAQIAANAQGRSQVLAALQIVINQALINGTISVGKTLNSSQQAFITNETGDIKAWYQVQNSGYWVDCIIEPIPDVSPTQYQANYTLIYSKDDVIRKVVGTHTLI